MDRILTDIRIYPIKSLGGISLPSAYLTPRGLEHDRRWMLVNEASHFLTIRQHPEFLFFNLQYDNNVFLVSKKGDADSLKIPFSINSGATVKVKIWDDEVEAIEGDAAFGKWFSSKLGFNCRLVYMPDTSARRVEPKWVKKEAHVSFADAYPFSITGLSSLADLNGKMNGDITMQRFRPSLIYEGGEAYEEFLWKDIEIGAGKLKCVKPITRCIVTTLNPVSAEKGKEPLKTLFKQRVNDKMVFAQSAVLVESARVNIGDKIVINTTKQSPYEPL